LAAFNFFNFFNFFNSVNFFKFCNLLSTYVKAGWETDWLDITRVCGSRVGCLK
jgi:hypothetical protein